MRRRSRVRPGGASARRMTRPMTLTFPTTRRFNRHTETILIYSAKHFGSSGRTTAMLAALLVSGLSACGNGNSGTTVKAPAVNSTPAVNNKGLWIANGTNVLQYVPVELAGGAS